MRKPCTVYDCITSGPQTQKLETIELLSPTVSEGHEGGQFLGVASPGGSGLRVSPRAAVTWWARMAGMCRCGRGWSSSFRVAHVPGAKCHPFGRTARMSSPWGSRGFPCGSHAEKSLRRGRCRAFHVVASKSSTISLPPLHPSPLD